VAIDPFNLLELDHRHVEQLLEQLAESEAGPEREAALTDLERSLTVHMQFEEQDVYPLAAEEIDAESAREGEIEHGLARDGLSKLRQLVAAPGFGAAVEMLKGGISHHVEEEEGEMFPQLRSKTPADIQERLAADMVAGKKAAGMPVVPPEATKDQLLEMARELDLEGRSSMDRDELTQAIAQSA
jgi:iron-sulfur cluster repair protein YtfE (RIC family)